jgi:hypothetical protein
MIKHVVIKTDGRVEFTDAAAAQDYFDRNTDCVRIDIVDEPDSAAPEQAREVANWRIVAILTLMGLDDDVNNMIDSFQEPDRTIAKMGYQRGNTIDRTSPIVFAIQQALNLTNQQVDEIFSQAENIPA